MPTIKDDSDDPLAHLASIDATGGRVPIHPTEVKGKWISRRQWIYLFFLGTWLYLPWIQINGNPAFQMDILHRRLHFFGQSFNAQDTWMLFFVITGTAFSLFMLSAFAGRIWCGFACPHTVMLEFLYRPVEAFFEGKPAARRRRDLKGFRQWNADDWRRKIAKWSVFFVWSLGLAHCTLAYFVSLPELWEMVQHRPAEHWQVFLWMLFLTGAFYGNFTWFREQMCLVLCPYGRMQSLLTDEDTYVVGYDAIRGEPRGRPKKNSTEQFGDCINCRKCVAVCPTGIDIRNGLQIECIGCTACIDACDSIMIKQNKPIGLIRFDSLNGLEHKPKRFWRPRVFLYLFAGLAGIGALTFVALNSTSVAINALRLPGTPYSVTDNVVQNAYELHIENKRSADVDLVVEDHFPEGFTLIAPQKNLHLDKRKGLRVPIFVRIPQDQFTGDETLHLHIMQEDDPIVVDLRFLGPNVTAQNEVP